MIDLKFVVTANGTIALALASHVALPRSSVNFTSPEDNENDATFRNIEEDYHVIHLLKILTALLSPIRSG